MSKFLKHVSANKAFLLEIADSGLDLLQDLRIDFQFDKAAFEFKALPFKIPYPVPFKLLGDETKAGPLLHVNKNH